ncbi:MAG: flagellar basal body-associated FliL family protein [Oleiphilus sp.]
MADDNNTEEKQEEGKKSNKKTIIIVALVAVLAVGLSVGVTLFLLTSDDSPAEEEAAPEEPVKLPASYFDIKPPFLVTFNVDGRQRYMQISLSVASRDANVFNSMEHHMPLIRSRLISTYGGQDFNEIKTEAGKVALQQKTVELINSILSNEGEESQIENVYFTNFVLQ